jgi:hypothetical protein
MPIRGPGRNVARYGANVRHFRRSADAKLTQFRAGIWILLQKWCTFAIKDWLWVLWPSMRRPVGVKFCFAFLDSTFLS